MNVVVVSSMYYRPGIHICGRAVHRQVLELSRLDARVSVIEPCPVFFPPVRNVWGEDVAELEDIVRLDGIPVHRLQYRKLLPLKWAPKAGVRSLRSELLESLRRIHAEVSLDLVHAHVLFPTACAAVPAASQLGIPVLATAHGSDVHTHSENNRIIRRLVRKAVASSSRTLAVSHGLAREIRALVGEGPRIEVNHLGVDLEKFRPTTCRRRLRERLGLPPDGVGICMVGRLVKEKGVNELFRAFVRLRAQDPECWLLVVGDGPIKATLEGWAREAGVASALHLTGSRPHGEIPNLLNSADIFTLPSYDEGLPNTILEAMACGLPVVATDVGGVSDAVVDGESGLLIQPARIDALTDALARLVSDSDLRQEMGQNGREIARDRFTWKKSARRLFSIYSGTLGGASRIDQHKDAPRDQTPTSLEEITK